MNKCDYIEEVKEDVINYILENYEEGDTINQVRLYDDCFLDDSVTGNASGSYYCNSYKAFEALGNNIEELVEEIESTFGEIPNEERYNWEFIDVSVRCAVLSEAIAEARTYLEESGHNYIWED